MTSPEELLEAINDVSTAHGINVPVGDRVAITRALAGLPVGTLTATRVAEAFEAQGLRRPPDAVCSAIVSRVGRLCGARSLGDVLLDFRRWAIDQLCAEFGAGKSKAREESLRNHIGGFLTTHAEVEARSGRGKTDLFLTDLDTVIEVKVWTNQSTYDAGVEELRRYIHTKNPAAAFMVVFCDRESLPAIAVSHRVPFAQPLNLEGLTVPVIVVPFEGVAPSKALRAKKARTRIGR